MTEKKGEYENECEPGNLLKVVDEMDKMLCLELDVNVTSLDSAENDEVTEENHDGLLDDVEDNYTVTDDIEDRTNYKLTSTPQLGYHMPNSFNCRLWTNIQTLRLGFELFLVIFRWAITEKNLYLELGNSINDRVLQFLFLSTSQQNS